MSFSNRVLGFGAFPNRDTTYEIEQSCMFAASDSAYLERTPSSASNQKTWTWSGWVKRSILASGDWQMLFAAHNNSGGSGGGWCAFQLNADTLYFNAWSTNWRQTNRLFRDVAAWYHIVLAVDTTQSTADNRIKIYVNGVQETSFQIKNNPAEDADLGVNSTVKHRLGAVDYASDNGNYDGYMAEVHFIDGTALTPSSFGETNPATGQWIPKEVTSVTYGTNGFYLKFVSGAIGTDSSGEGNNYTANNIVNDDIFLDSPTNNFATANPLSASTDIDWYQGNLVPYQPTQSNFGVTVSTIAVESGKYYAEFRLRGTDSNAQYIGAGTYVPIVDNSNQNGNGSGNVVLFPQNSTAANRAIVVDGTAITTDLTAGSEGDKYGVALDADNAKVYFYRNGSTIGSTSGYSITDVGTGKYHFIIGVRGSSGYIGYWEANFGANSSFAGNETKQNNGGEGEDFYYTPPTGYKALSTANLPVPTITKPTDYFNTVLYTGNNSTNHDISGVGFQPDFTWIKNRSQADSNVLHDAVRGVGKVVYADLTLAENNNADLFGPFQTDGFRLSPTSVGHAYNASSENYVSWNWLAGTAFSNDASETSIGSIDSSGEANADAGFSIVSFTMPSSGQATVKHGLSVKPKMIITKDRESSSFNWAVFHEDVTDTTSKFLRLNTTDGIVTYSTVWGAAMPTSSVFGVTAGGLATASNDVIAYCFAEIEGYSKIGSYTGNGSADGAFVFTGFRPAWVMIKGTSASRAWCMWDNKRDSYNVAIELLMADDDSAGLTSYNIDFVSNGFKARANNTYWNGSSETYTYIAFAEFPFKYSNAR